jgi:hypothetical protein
VSLRIPDHHRHSEIPAKGDRVELLEARAGVRARGTVFYSDQVQILVKWDDGRSGNLTPGIDRFRIVDRADSPDR